MGRIVVIYIRAKRFGHDWSEWKSTTPSVLPQPVYDAFFGSGNRYKRVMLTDDYGRVEFKMTSAQEGV